MEGMGGGREGGMGREGGRDEVGVGGERETMRMCVCWGEAGSQAEIQTAALHGHPLGAVLRLWREAWSLNSGLSCGSFWALPGPMEGLPGTALKRYIYIYRTDKNRARSRRTQAAFLAKMVLA